MTLGYPNRYAGYTRVVYIDFRMPSRAVGSRVEDGEG
jgi:hypothetical protein